MEGSLNMADIKDLDMSTQQDLETLDKTPSETVQEEVIFDPDADIKKIPLGAWVRKIDFLPEKIVTLVQLGKHTNHFGKEVYVLYGNMDNTDFKFECGQRLVNQLFDVVGPYKEWANKKVKFTPVENEWDVNGQMTKGHEIIISKV